MPGALPQTYSQRSARLVSFIPGFSQVPRKGEIKRSSLFTWLKPGVNETVGPHLRQSEPGRS